MRKPAFCICENKGADQLHGNRNFKPLAIFCGCTAWLNLCWIWLETLKTGFLISSGHIKICFMQKKNMQYRQKACTSKKACTSRVWFSFWLMMSTYFPMVPVMTDCYSFLHTRRLWDMFSEVFRQHQQTSPSCGGRLDFDYASEQQRMLCWKEKSNL